uniref:Dentin sialophosphoprotein-like n=1 Tax=Strongyloides venezuelensis TaxID=75913 RepID=A0A0K0FB51_STRVS
MFSRRFKSSLSKGENKPVVKKKYANILEYMADNGINPNVTREELNEVLRLSDGMWQQLCVDSGLDCIPSGRDSVGQRKRKLSELNEESVEVRKKPLLNKGTSFISTQSTDDSSMEVGDSTALTKDSSAAGSVNILQDSDFMALAATANTTSNSISNSGNGTIAMDVYETTNASSQPSSLNIQNDSTFMALANRTSSTNFPQNKDFTLDSDITDTGEHRSLKDVTASNAIVNSSSASEDFSSDMDVKQKDGSQDFGHERNHSKVTGEEVLNVTTSESVVVSHSKRTKFSLRKMPKLDSIQEDLPLDDQDNGDEISSSTLHGNLDVDNKTVTDDSALEPSSRQTEMQSIHLLQDQDFLDLAGISGSEQKSMWRGRKFNGSTSTVSSVVKNDDSLDFQRGCSRSKTTGEEVSNVTTSENTVISHTKRTRFNLRKRLNLDAIEEDSLLESKRDNDKISSVTLEESVIVSSKNAVNDSALEPSSRQTEMHSIQLLQDQDFRVLAGISNSEQKSTWRGRKLNGSTTSSVGQLSERENKNVKVPSVDASNCENSNGLAETSNVPKKSRWCRKTSNTTGESTTVESDGSSDKLTTSSINSSSFAIPQGPVIPRNNFDITTSVASESTPFLKRRSLRSVSNNSIDTRVLPIKARKNLDVSSFLNANPKIAFQEIQQRRKTKIIVNDDTSEKELFKNDSVVGKKAKEHSRSTLSSQSLLSSQGDDDGEEKVLRRSERISKRNIVNIDDSLFQTATPAIRKPGRKKLNQSKTANDETTMSRSCSPESIMSEGYSEFPLLIDESDANLNGSSKKGTKHAVIRGKKEKQKVLVVRRPRIIKPNEDQIQFTNLRRSRRNRIPPVDTSLLQKPIYERDENGLLTLVGVSEVEVKDPLFVKYGTADFTEINNIRAVQQRAKRQKKLAKEQNLAYYGIKHCK